MARDSPSRNPVAFGLLMAHREDVTDFEIAKLARRQHMLVTLDQLRNLGLSEDAVRHRLEAGRLERLEPRLFRIGGSEESWRQRVLGACLSVGEHAVACRQTAAVLWELIRLDEPPVELAVPRPRSPQWVSAKIFRSTDIIGAHRTVLDGIPVTTVARTLVDLGAVASPSMVENAVDAAVVSRLTTVRELRAMLDNVARQGRRGVGALRAAIEFLEEGPESVLEAKLLRLILGSTLPRPTLQHRVNAGGRQRYRIDIAYPEVMIAIEADGRGPHSSGEAFERDRERQNTLEILGWTFLRFTWHQVTRRQEWVLSQIRDLYRARARFLTANPGP